MSEKDILQKTLVAIMRTHPFTVCQTDVLYPSQTLDKTAHAIITITYGETEHRLITKVKTRFDKTMAALHLAESHDKERTVIITPYVSAEMADRLKNYHIEFMDTCGNLFLNRPPLYLFVKGNKSHDILKPEPVIRAFKASGLKVIFTLLSLPNSEKKTFRELASLSNVSLGTANWVLKDLQTLGFLINGGSHGRKLIKKIELMDRWVTAYPEQLKNKLNKKVYSSDNICWWKDTTFEENNAFWSGEVAASKLTAYLTSETVTLYTKKPLTKLIVNNKLRHDNLGKIEILDTFWNFHHGHARSSTAPPILVYADLMSTCNSRNIETAGIIYHDYITELIE
ncbi:MAG: type IV toxin-antitoxin system AbiEi family antitoxin [Desulfobacteraceae bacterium]|jgi:hypothetical protein